jgi:putative tryptophan/tyrosine transport system substrate-binding protein
MPSLYLRAAPRVDPIAVLVNINNIEHEPHLREAIQAAQTLKAQVRRVELCGAANPHGENLGDSARQSVRHVDRLLKGADPATLPVEQPTRFELVLNLKTAQALRMNFTPNLRVQADRVIG